MPNDLLFEIGVEEIPADVVLPALQQMEQGIRDGLANLRLSHGDVQTFGTPRRLAILVADVADGQEDAHLEVKGPAAQAAFDVEGKPTKAAQGFARSRGLAPEDLVVRETDRGSFVFVLVTEKGKTAAEVLPDLLLGVLGSLTFPKTMRWADYDLRFARPIRWLVALYGEQVLDMQVADVKSGRVSRGHRFLGSQTVEIARPSDYLQAMRDNRVVALTEERKEEIRRQAIAAAEAVGGHARISDKLLTEVSFLVEYPTCLVGHFAEKYLELPREVVVTVMQGHQKYFPIEDAQGRLLPRFIAIRNGDDQGLDNIRRGNERVIEPRLADAEFYFREDMRHKLADRLDALKRVNFMEGLGNLYDKTQRLVTTVRWLGEHAPGITPEDVATGVRAAELSKCDLVTLMIGDSKLGELQGIVGGHYARLSGEADAVAAAISEHYQPRSTDDAPPASVAGQLVSIADKMDNLAACFRLGLIPSGSADPFALRRQCQGIVSTLYEGALRVDLPRLVRFAVAQVPEPPAHNADKALAPQAAVEALLRFFAQRIEATCQARGVEYDIIRAVLAVPCPDVIDAIDRAVFLSDARRTAADFGEVVTAAARPANIVASAKEPPQRSVDTALFDDVSEGALYQAYLGALAAADTAQAAPPPDYPAIWRSLALMIPAIDRLFVAVMVMVDDPAIRENRLALLRDVDSLFRRMADFREVVQPG
jgi:glycyl-tRNA synthetase beta chain